MLTIGQIVGIKDNLIVDQFYGGARFHNGMSKYKGRKCKISAIPHYDNKKYHISIDNEGYDFTEDMLIVLK